MNVTNRLTKDYCTQTHTHTHTHTHIPTHIHTHPHKPTTRGDSSAGDVLPGNQGHGPCPPVAYGTAHQGIVNE